MSTSLDELVEQTYEQVQQYCLEQEKKAKEERKAKEEQQERFLRALLEKTLSPTLIEQLTFKYHHAYNHQGQYSGISATFGYQGDSWKLSYSKKDRGGNEVVWDIICNSTHKANYVESADLTSRLLVELAKRQPGRLEEEQRTAKQAEAAAAYALREQQAEAEKAVRQAEAQATHERLQAHVVTVRERAEQAMWRWPAGVTITLYTITYCTGGYSSEEGEGFDYSTGWTTTSSLDEGGWITIYPEHEYDWEKVREPRRVKLTSVADHHVIWTEHRYSSLEMLPKGLRQAVKVVFPRIIERYNHDVGERCLTEDPTGKDEEYWHSETIGEEPLAWVRDLVDQQNSL